MKIAFILSKLSAGKGKSVSFDHTLYEYKQVILAYQILEIPLCSDESVAKKSYYRLARKWHPDKNPGMEGVEDKFKDISGAKDYLEKFKEEIARDKTAIQAYAINPETTQTSRVSNPAAAPHFASQNSKTSQKTNDFNQTQEEEEQNFYTQEREDSRRKEENLAKKIALLKMQEEIKKMLVVLQPIFIPPGYSEESIHQGLLNLLNDRLLLEAVQVKTNLRIFASKLNQKLTEVQQAYRKNDNYAHSFLFSELNYIRTVREQKLSAQRFLISKAFNRVISLNEKMTSLMQSLESSTDLSEKCCDLLALNEILEDVNTLIAKAQCAEYYHSEITEDLDIKTNAPAENLHINYLTRVTESFLNDSKNLRKQCTSLNLERNNLFKVSPALTAWEKLERIEMMNSPQIGFPEFLCDMSNLRSLSLKGNGIHSIPKNISNLTKLEELHCSNNFISELPTSLNALEHLNILDLSDNRFRDIPKVVGELSNLRCLNFCNTTLDINEQGNCLTQLPEELAALSKLEVLNLNNNDVFCLPETIFGKMNNLTTLLVANNNLCALPKNIGDLKSLKVLDAKKNMISFIPSSILKLKKSLQHCFLNENLLHQNATAVQAVMVLMGTPIDQIKCLFELQTPTDVTPMQLDDVSFAEEDGDLMYITREFSLYLQNLERQRILTASRECAGFVQSNHIKVKC